MNGPPTLLRRVPSNAVLRAFFQRCRLERGLTPIELAKKAGVSRDFVKVLETRAQKTLDGHDLARVMFVLGVQHLPEPEDAPALEVWWEPSSRVVRMSLALRNELRELRRRRGWTLTDVADRTGMKSAPSVRYYEVREDGRDKVGAASLAKIATVLQVGARTVPGQRLLRIGFKWVGPQHNAPRLLPRMIDWNNAGLGDEHDTTIADRLGVDVRAVWRARMERGIPPCSKKKKKGGLYKTTERLKEGVFKNLGPRPLDEDGNILWRYVPFGQVRDSMLAQWLGVSKYSVTYRRNRYGIPSAPCSLVDWKRLPLGEIPDTHIAHMTGLSTPSVGLRRKRMGIPPVKTFEGTSMPPDKLDPTEFVIRPCRVDLGPMPPKR